MAAGEEGTEGSGGGCGQKVKTKLFKAEQTDREGRSEGGEGGRVRGRDNRRASGLTEPRTTLRITDLPEKSPRSPLIGERLPDFFFFPNGLKNCQMTCDRQPGRCGEDLGQVRRDPEGARLRNPACVKVRRYSWVRVNESGRVSGRALDIVDQCSSSLLRRALFSFLLQNLRPNLNSFL